MTKSPLSFIAALGAGLTIAFSASGGGHSAPPEIGARKGIMSNYAYNLGLLGAMAKGEVEYDADIAAIASANLVAFASSDQSLLWKEGTDNAAAQGTRALPAIWSDPAGFKKAADALTAAAEGLAATSDLAGLQAAMGAAGAGCGTCHKAYRAPN